MSNDETGAPDWDDFEFEDDDGDASSPDYKALLAEITKRCDLAKIEYEFSEYGEDIDLVINLPSARESRAVWVSDIFDARAFLGIEFENLVFVPGYDGVWDKKRNSLEMGITARSGFRLRKVLRDAGGELSLDPPTILQPKISIGEPSDSLGILTGRRGSRFSLKLEMQEGVALKTSSEALRLIERYGLSLLYQIDSVWNVAASLTRERRRRHATIIGRHDREIGLTYPKFEYERAPISLYNYGRNAAGMPLLQFLAYYQVAEYFFPFFSKIEAQKRIRSILKRPTFRSEKDSDIGQIISAIQETRAGALYDERTLLKATLKEVFSPNELRDFLNKNRYSEFFKNDFKKVHSVKLTVDSDKADIIDQVAERLYGIRCKIVHTKAGTLADELDLIVPYSEEEQYLGPDVELMSFVARRCIDSSGTAIT